MSENYSNARSIYWKETRGVSNPYEVIFKREFAESFFGKDYYVYINEGNPHMEVSNDFGVLLVYYTHDDICSEEGEDLISTDEPGVYRWYQPAWAYHLQRMIVSENPLLYLENWMDRPKWIEYQHTV